VEGQGPNPYTTPAHALLASRTSASATLPDEDTETACVPDAKEPAARTKLQKKNARKNAAKRLKKVTARAMALEGENDGPSQPVPQPQAIPEGDYVLKVNHFVEIANFLAEKGAAIPIQLLQLLRRCIRLRAAVFKNKLSNPDLSTITHGHFIDVLRATGHVLHEAREKRLDLDLRKAANARGNAQQPERAPKGSDNRFASLSDLIEEIDEKEEMESMIHLGHPAPPQGAAVLATHAKFDIEDTHEDAAAAAMDYLNEAMNARRYIICTWIKYKEGSIDLVRAAIITNTALELLREAHDEVMPKILAHCNNDLECLMATFLPALYAWPASGPDGSLSPWLQQLAYDSTFVSAFISMRCMAEECKGKLIVPNHLSKATFTHLPVLIADPLAAPDDRDGLVRRIKQYRQQTMEAVIGSYSQYAMLLHVTGGPEDEMARSCHETIVRCKADVHAGVCAQVYVDIASVLGDGRGRAKAELQHQFRLVQAMLERNAAEEAKASIEEFSASKLIFGKITRYLDENLQDVDVLAEASWCGRTPPTPDAMRSALRTDNPTMCGMELIRLQLVYQDMSMLLANHWLTVLEVIHLYHACKEFGPLETDAFPAWPELDLLLRCQDREKLFGGKVPLTPVDAHISSLNVGGYSMGTMQYMRRGDDGSRTLNSFGPITNKARKIRAHFMLEDRSEVIKLFKRKLVRNPSEMLQDAAFLAQTLSEWTREDEQAARDEADQETEAQRKKETGKQKRKKKAATASPAYSIPRLMDSLAARLAREDTMLSIDFVKLHLDCVDLLRRIRPVLHDSLVENNGPDYLPDDSQLPNLVSWVLRLTAAMQQINERVDPEWMWTRSRDGFRCEPELLDGCTVVFADFLREKFGSGGDGGATTPSPSSAAP
ncbi:hypothetical protein OC835_007765, partial [Tilletia horrida]